MHRMMCVFATVYVVRGKWLRMISRNFFLEGLRKNVKVVKKYRRILRILDKKENELYEYKGIVNHTDICWQRLAEETTGSSDV